MEIDVPGTLMDLLFVRSVWDLDGPPGLPRTSPLPNPGTTIRPDSPGLDTAWTALWQAAVRRDIPSHAAWMAVLGVEEVDREAMRVWSNSTRQRINDEIVGQSRPLEQTSLMRRSTTAEAAGISSVLIVPVEGRYAEHATPTGVVVSEATYTDDEAWAVALTRR